MISFIDISKKIVFDCLVQFLSILQNAKNSQLTEQLKTESANRAARGWGC